ncbi:hypothetical protein [Sphingopyxis sp. QXT-31]|uniref:hypothetical protein n=1 Tax=Sphingopyxis sp. QXT-31 TaxID=1357916 RepID=UPI0012EC631F|nr:hypothetical protein [Sphingopyxis sp. QXT-31]
MTAIETGVVGLALLMIIVSAGELALYPDTLDSIAQNFFFLWVLFAMILPFALLVALFVLWPTATISGAVLLVGAKRDRRLAGPRLWSVIGLAIGLCYGWLFFVSGLPRFDIVEGPLAPTAALVWTGASGAFAGWRLHRKLGRAGCFAPPAAA